MEIMYIKVVKECQGERKCVIYYGAETAILLYMLLIWVHWEVIAEYWSSISA